MRRRSTILALVLLTACAAPSDTTPALTPRAPDEPGWHAIAASPLGPRYRATALWTGERVVVLGGTDDLSCLPGLDCAPADPPRRDAAAYDPVSDTWSELPAAPVPLGHLAGAAHEGTLYVYVPGSEGPPGVHTAFLSLPPGDAGWEELTPPPVAAGSVGLVASRDRIVAYQLSHERGIVPDMRYDPATDSWAELPLDPLAPSFDRSVVQTDVGLVVVGLRLVPNPGATEPPLYRAARLDEASMSWQLLPDSEIVGWDPRWAWVDGRIVNITLGQSDGGQVNGWDRPYPHGGMLDPRAGRWSGLPAPPPADTWLFGISVAGEGWAVAGEGWALHVATEQWHAVGQPPGAFPTEGVALAWAGDRLFAWGGAIAGADQPLVGSGWVWVPPAT